MKSIKFNRFSIALYSLCLFLCGCAATKTTTTDGRYFDSSKCGRIVKGKTTADDLVAMFGAPYETQVASDGAATWVYRCTTTTSKSSGFTVGGGIAAILVPGTVGTMVASQNYNPSFSVHSKTLTVGLDNQKVVSHFDLKK